MSEYPSVIETKDGEVVRVLNEGTPAPIDPRTLTLHEANPRQGDVGDSDTKVHGTQKPLECMERPIRHHEGDVYEPFAGSGTTIVAAERQNRTCYAMEIDPGYVAVILERLSQMGLTPELKSDVAIAA